MSTRTVPPTNLARSLVGPGHRTQQKGSTT